jgi:1-aminocyclopropane-1-carboxylate deaminase/D-cysteine desulfhydrase-like pyridoxal-dependent ACC family enzyme
MDSLIEQYNNIYILRLDKRETYGIYGDKARIAYEMSKGQNGIVTCGSRDSIQTVAFAKVCDVLGIPCDIHIPKGKDTDSILQLQSTNCSLIREKVGYNNVLNAHARNNAKDKEYKFIQLGMLCDEAYELIGQNVDLIIPYINNIKRIVIPVGSGTTLIGIVKALQKHNINIPVVGVMCGMDATKNILNNTDYKNIMLVKSDSAYHKKEKTQFCGITLNPTYEAKCVPYLQDGDLFYIVA